MKFSKPLFFALNLLLLAGCNKDNVIVGPDNDDDEPKVVKVSVVDYAPAPGQFVNELPLASESTTYPEILAACNSSLEKGSLVSLGSLGGSITLKTEEPVDGRFMVMGNAISTSAEPGIVSISADGVMFYELRGEFYSESEVVTITYERPEDGTDASEHIRYTIQPSGATGYIPQLVNHHNHTYYPYWIDDNKVTFTCRRLPDNGFIDTDGLYKLRPYGGYADSFPNTSKYAVLDPGNAVDSNGNKVNVGTFSYIRITTGILQNNGELGECSTEVSGVMVY